MKKSCILIQCYVKPEETKQVLHTIERCSEINEYTLVLYVDSAPDHSKFKSPNQQLIESLLEYKNQKINRFKDIIVKIADHNLGPYLCCGQALNCCLNILINMVFFGVPIMIIHVL
jgi:hypothetical protein